MTAAEKAERDKQVFADRARGLSWEKVASAHDISVRTAERIWDEQQKLGVPEMQEKDALSIVWETLQRYEEWQNQLAEVTAESNGAVKIGAIRAQMDCEVKKSDLRQATGLLPKHLGKLAVEWDVRFVVRQVVAVLEEHNAPPEMEQALLAALNPGNAEG